VHRLGKSGIKRTTAPSPEALEGRAGRMGVEEFGDVLLVNDSAFAALKGCPDGLYFRFASEVGESDNLSPGTPLERLWCGPRRGVLLSAHLDHLGIGPAVNGDSIYNGADDDASGTTAVLESHALRSRRNLGGPSSSLCSAVRGWRVGSTWFQDTPPVSSRQDRGKLGVR